MPRFADPTTSPAVSNCQCINLMRDKTCVKLLLWRRNDNGLILKLSANLSYSFVSWACLVGPTKSRSGNLIYPVGLSISSTVVFSERELMFRFAICYRRSNSVVCLSVVCLWRWCTLLRRLKFSAIFLRLLVSWPSIDIYRQFYVDRPRGTPPSGDLNARVVVKYSNFDIWNAITLKRCKIRGKLVLITNRKSYMGFRLVPKLVTLNDLERRNAQECRLLQLPPVHVYRTHRQWHLPAGNYSVCVLRQTRPVDDIVFDIRRLQDYRLDVPPYGLWEMELAPR